MMDSVADIYRPTSVSRDAAQGTVQNWSRIAFQVPCSQQQAGVMSKILYGQNNASLSTTLYFADDPGTTKNDRIVATDETLELTNHYNVMGRAQPVARGQLWSVDCELIDASDVPMESPYAD